MLRGVLWRCITHFGQNILSEMSTCPICIFMKIKKCLNCPAIIDKRSLRCYTCRAKFNNSFLGKSHSKKSKILIGKKSSKKFTPEYKEKNYHSKCRGTTTRSINGYVLVKNYDHPNRNSHNDILEHILIVSGMVGRPLKKGEVVHHINCIRDDNRLENLFLFKNRSEHKKCHGTVNKLIRTLLEKHIIVFIDGRYELNSNFHLTNP